MLSLSFKATLMKWVIPVITPSPQILTIMFLKEDKLVEENTSMES